MNKSQSSFEFISIFGIGLILILLLGGIFFTISDRAKDSLDQQQIDNIGNEIISNIEKIYFRGSGNKITLNAKFPEKIENFTIHQGSGTQGSYSYLNISYVSDGNVFSSLYFPSEIFVRFNCTQCYTNPNPIPAANPFNTTYFNDSDHSAGTKTITIISYGNWVSLDFQR